jgi:hypothetical protein
MDIERDASGFDKSIIKSLAKDINIERHITIRCRYVGLFKK